ncbi:MAG: protein kinase domain-containing protein [Saprospiraceae bacterium]
MEQQANIIEQLIAADRLPEAHKAFADFLRTCEQERLKLLQNQGRLSSLESQQQANVVGNTAVFERNSIRLAFQTQLDEFRQNVLARYFNVANLQEFFDSLTSRDAVIHTLLDYRLRPKRYLREEKLEEGNSSIIFRLQMPDTHRHAIAMVFKLPALSDNLRQEIETLTDLRHRNVIKLLDRELSTFPFFVITEYVYGENLPEALEIVGPRPAAQVADWLYQLTDALDYLRHKRILHTNVRPSKIYVDDEWQIMISPFDLNRVGAGENSVQTGSVERSLNRYRDVCQYGSPELLARDGQGMPLREMCISDQYSLGLIGYKMLMNKDLFEGRSVYAILESRRRFAQDKAYRKEKLAALPPGEVSQIIQQLLIEKPDDRARKFEDLHALLRALHPLTRTEATDVSATRKSYRRCLAANREFIHDFYRNFHAKSPHTEPDFGGPMSRKRQSAMLQMAVDLLLDLDANKGLLEKLFHPTNAKHGKYADGDFESFLDAFLETVAATDPRWDATLETEWRRVREQSLAAIREIRAAAPEAHR